jgi:hypothetical protein
MKLKNLILAPIFMTLTLTGCGDLFSKKVAEQKLESTRLKANCDLDMDELADILVKPITGTLTCLQKNLEIFIQVSELGRGGKLSRVALVNYLKQNMPNIKPSTYPAIHAVFDLAHLITGESKDFISKENVVQILELVKMFNIHSYRHYSNTFGSDRPANLPVHESHRKRVEDAATQIQQELMKIYVADRGDSINQLDIMDLVEAFVPSGDPEILAKVEGLLFAKKILVGGEPKTINHKELGFLFDHLPKLLSLVLDAVRYKHLILEQADAMKFLQEDAYDLTNILFHPVRGDRRFEPLFHVDMAIDGIDRLLDEDKRIGKYRSLIVEVKKILTKTKNDFQNQEEQEWVLGKDLEKIFSHVFNITNRNLAFHKIYQSPNIKPQLEAPISVYLDPKKYELEFPENKSDLVEFSRVANTYRYFKGHEEMAYYSGDYRRNADAFGEVAIYEYLIKTAFGYYGSSLSMGNEQLRDILKRFENELIEMDIILPRRSRNIAETISLLGSLFQYQSDNNTVLDVDEATEFAISLFTSLKAKKEIFKFFEAKNCAIDQFGRVEPGCFKENFYEALCTNYRKYFPKLFEYLSADNNLGCDQNFNSFHNLQYIDASAKAARTCQIYPDDQKEIPYSEGDIMSMLLAMMHVETTIARWDTRTVNNLMDHEEVVDAYAIYKPAIMGMLPKLPSVLNTAKIRETLAKQVYLYLVKFEEVPQTKQGKDIWKLVKFLLSFNAKKAPATRKTISSILWIVSEEGKKKSIAEGDPQFDCNWMHDPDNIPRD